jgi:hypothetical protein
VNGNAKLWLIPAALLVVAGIVSFVAQIAILPGDVEASDWKPPAEYVLEHIGPNDVLNVQPNWTDDPYPYLTEVGDRIARQDKPLVEDTWSRERIWLLVETERIDEALELMPFEAAETKSFGDVSVVRIDVPENPPVTYELLPNLDGAKVTRTKGGKVVERCTNWNKRNEAWYCGRPDRWVYVGREFVDLGGDPHQCIWAHPPPDQKRVRVVFPDVPLQETFRLRAGLNQRGARSKRATDLHYRVSVGEKWSQQKTIPARETSWEPIDFDTSEMAGHTADVTVEVWAESIFDRFFCFNGWVLQTSSN